MSRATENPRFTQTPEDAHSKTVRAAGTWTGRQQTRVAARDFTFVVDEPEKVGGRNEGATPMEYLAGSVGACIIVVIDQVSSRRGLELTGISTYSLARQDQRGLAGTADVQPHFHSYRLQVCVGTPETDEQVLRDFATAVEHSCPAVNILRDAHIDLTVAWQFTAEVEDGAAEAACNAALGYTSLSEHSAGTALTFENADAPGPAVGTDETGARG